MLAHANQGSHKPFIFVFTTLIAFGLIPLWIANYLPMTDLPQHLALINIMHHLNDPAMRFHEYFTLRTEFTPYLGYYWTVHLLAYFVPVEVANKLFLSAYVMGLGTATLWLAAALNRSRWLALFALPLTYSYPFYVGFVNWLAGEALLMSALAAYASRLQGKLSGWTGNLVLIALPLGCLATHVQPFTFFVAALAVMVAVFPGHRRATLAYAIPSLCLFVVWLVRLFMNDPPGPAAPRYIVFEPLVVRIAGFRAAVLDQFRDGFDAILMAAFAVMWVWGLALALRSPAKLRATGQRWLMPALSSGALAGYFLMPSHTHLMQFIHVRYATLACLLLALSVPLAEGAAPRAWRNALVALCAANSIYVGGQFLRFDREAGDFRALANQVEANSCVATIDGYMKSGVMIEPGLYNHFAGYVSLWRGALPAYTLAGMPHQSLAYRRADGSQASGYVDAAFPVVLEHEPPHHIARGTLYFAYGSFYRYFLVPKARDLRQLFRSDASRLVKLGESGPLALYENDGGHCGVDRR